GCVDGSATIPAGRAAPGGISIGDVRDVRIEDQALMSAEAVHFREPDVADLADRTTPRAVRFHSQIDAGRTREPRAPVRIGRADRFVRCHANPLYPCTRGGAHHPEGQVVPPGEAIV